MRPASRGTPWSYEKAPATTAQYSLYGASTGSREPQGATERSYFCCWNSVGAGIITDEGIVVAVRKDNLGLG